VVLLVQRKGQTIEFDLDTWPYRSFLQVLGRQSRAGDCEEWIELCAEINRFLAGEIKPEFLESNTFKEADES